MTLVPNFLTPPHLAYTRARSGQLARSRLYIESCKFDEGPVGELWGPCDARQRNLILREAGEKKCVPCHGGDTVSCFHVQMAFYVILWTALWCVGAASIYTFFWLCLDVQTAISAWAHGSLGERVDSFFTEDVSAYGARVAELLGTVTGSTPWWLGTRALVFVGCAVRAQHV